MSVLQKAGMSRLPGLCLLSLADAESSSAPAARVTKAKKSIVKLRAQPIVRGGTQLAAAERTSLKISDLLFPNEEGSLLELHRFNGPDGMAGTLHRGLGATRASTAPEPFGKSNHPVLTSCWPRVSGSKGRKASDQF